MYHDCNVIKAKVVPQHAMKAPGERGSISSYSYSTSALDGSEWSASRPGERTPVALCTGGWVGPRAGLCRGYRKNPLPLPGIEPRSPGRPARSLTLYCLSYPAHYCNVILHYITMSCCGSCTVENPECQLVTSTTCYSAVVISWNSQVAEHYISC
jgi:hypothetical protein